jgi:Family of unknown function (DUF6011)
MNQSPMFGPIRSGTCLRCRRVLTAPKSVEAGMGPVCAARMRDYAERHTLAEHDLPFDWGTMDVVCRRDADGGKHFNIPQVHIEHSPGGFEWGYGGSGPSDYALNILAIFLPTPKRARVDPWGGGNAVKLHGGTTLSRAAWALHHDFKFRFVATLPREGGTIGGDEIRAWIAERLGAAAEAA